MAPELLDDFSKSKEGDGRAFGMTMLVRFYYAFGALNHCILVGTVHPITAFS